jgi:FkbM family methyltransferase
MKLLPRWLKEILKRSDALVAFNAAIRWKFHLLKDWWGQKIWTKTTEVTSPLGFKLTSGFHPAYELMRTGKFEVEETAIISKLLSRVDQFVDIGANLGYYTCLALHRGKPAIAFEPQHQNLQCLFQNLISNGWENKAEVLPLALSENPGLLTLYGASGPSASLVKNWAGYSSHYKKIVPVTTLDNVLSGRFIDKKLLIKIDVEGAEYQVLKGSLNTLNRRIKPIWLLEVCFKEFHPDGANPDFENIFNLFFSNGYSVYTATSVPSQVLQDDISLWMKNNSTNSGTFNYVFIDPDDNSLLF